MNWMYSCRKVAELLSQQLDEPLGRLERLRLRLHLSMCGNCSNVEQQLVGVKALTADLFSMDQPLNSDAESIGRRTNQPLSPDRSD